MPLWKWSRTAASNGTADGTAPWPEGMAPSQVNNSARGNMAAMAQWRDDVSGATVTTGTSTAYAVSTFSVFSAVADMTSQMIAFTAHATNTGAATLNVDGLGALPLRSFPGVDLPAGALILGTPYVVTYSAADAAFYLQGGLGNPYNIPLGAGIDYWGDTAPNSSFAFPLGQAISRTGSTAPLFALFGTKYGSGDGATTFNLPNKGGRVSAMKESTATLLTSAGSGVDGGTIGAKGGGETQSLVTAQIPSITSSRGQTITVDSNSSSIIVSAGLTGGWREGSGPATFQAFSPGTAVAGQQTSSRANTITVDSQGTGGSNPVHPNVQPTIICNYIIRII